MPQSTRPGHTFVVAVIVVMLLISASVIMTSVISRGADNLPRYLVRFMFTAILCWFLYRGANWARLLVSILSFLGGVFGMIAGASLISSNPIGGLLLILMGALYVACGCVLMFIPSVRTYFTAKAL